MTRFVKPYVITDWAVNREAQITYSYERFAQAKVFVFKKWCEKVAERGALAPTDLSGSCKYGSLFMNRIFGGVIRGHYEHQYNIIGGRIVDLSHDAIDVGRIANPYLHEPDFFAIPEKQASLNGCLPRVELWVIQFMAEIEASEISSLPES
ncbi:MAG: transcriptional regulator [Gammaproteobacteria bacterium]